MAFTQTDLDNIDAAIKKLQNGVSSVSWSGRTVTYRDLDELWTERERIEREIAGDDGRKLFAFVTTSKGL